MLTKKATDFSDLTDQLLEMVAGCFQALSNPTRLKMLCALKSGDKTVQQLVTMFNYTQPNISRHLSILAQAGLVKKTKKGAYVFYGIANPRVFSLCDGVCSHVNKTLEGYTKTSKRR